MFRHIRHAFLAGAAIVVTGWLLAQPGIQKTMRHEKYGHGAAAGLLIALALLVVVSLVLAARHRSPGGPRHTSPLATRRGK
jgi:hypothetical protein